MRGSIDDIIALPEVAAKIADLLEDPAYEFHREEVLPLVRRKSTAPHPPRADLSPLPLRDLKRSKTPLELGSCGDNAAIDFLEAFVRLRPELFVFVNVRSESRALVWAQFGVRQPVPVEQLTT